MASTATSRWSAANRGSPYTHKSFVRNDGGEPPADGTRNPYADFKGEKRSNATHRSTTDPEARLARKNNGDASRLAHMAHTMIEHRSGLIVDVECTELNGHAEIEVALAMLKRTAKPGSTVGADKNHDQQAFVQGARLVGLVARLACIRASCARRTPKGVETAPESSKRERKKLLLANIQQRRLVI
ncbi:hypothetical protein EV691_15812 [Azotobacter chroococcum]|uniref:Transposase IS4-like domain-containing protein n=1 Tax=Azotobacter chroococcum TaxID=353 RepID=A0A4R1NUD1_9GAMM|nr:hypothetical protein EV691_15812 [Azotobacter chroococcum]